MTGFKDRHLRREIAAVLAVKLTLLAVLWFAFVRGHEVAVNADRVAGVIGTAPHPTAESEQARHGQ